MKVSNPETRQQLAELANALNTETANVNAILASADAISQREANFRKSAEAAEAEAGTYRDNIRELLRDATSPQTKQLRDQSAGQRAAFSLAEEYRYLAEECALQKEEILLNAQEAALAIGNLRKKLIDDYANAIIEEALANLPANLALAIQLKQKIFSLSPYSTDAITYDRNASRAVSLQFSQAVRAIANAAINTGPLLDAEDQALTAIQASDLPILRNLSPMRIKIDREKFQKNRNDFAQGNQS